jgi:uncharacterized SAM-binding protein YcdF (DUF218 family)
MGVMRNPTRARVLLVLAAVVVVVVVARGALLSAGGNYLVAIDELGPADAIVVLGGNSPYRATHAVTLYRAGWAPRLVISNERVRTHGLDTTWADLYGRGIARLDVPADAVVVLHGLPENTYDEAIRSRDLMLARGWRHALVVTDPFHSHRAQLLFRSVWGPAGLEALSAPALESPAGVDRWWTNYDGVIHVTTEYAKLAWAVCTVDPLLVFR